VKDRILSVASTKLVHMPSSQPLIDIITITDTINENEIKPLYAFYISIPTLNAFANMGLNRLELENKRINLLLRNCRGLPLQRA
jgi:hypothetical protein